MTIRRILQHFEAKDWLAVSIELVVVVFGVFIGIQVANWNEARLEAARKHQIVEALITDISDAIGVQQEFIDDIDLGLSEWERSYARGEKPAPFYFRIIGSEFAPDTWGTLQTMQLVDLFDPETLFDLSFYYSELEGVGQKYVRYVTFVEEHVLPYAEAQVEIFYEDDNLKLKPMFRANMDRLRDFRDDSLRLMKWQQCLVFRLQSDRTFNTTCLRADFVLDGMVEATRTPVQ
jgi:hypothetical protein